MGLSGGPLARRRILVTGGTGQVGCELLKMLAPLGEVIAPGREDMDLARVESVRKMIRSVQPCWIVNPAAYTAVDKAESDPELAYAINAQAVQVMGETACEIGAAVIHFSTDYVFDGTKTTPYLETDDTEPLGVYGASKLAGEKALAESGAMHMIFRSSWIYGARGKNFLLTILRLAQEKETINVVDDQYGSPTWSRDLAEMTAHVIRHCIELSVIDGEKKIGAISALNGIYHAASSGETTWYEFATEAVLLQKERQPDRCFADVLAISTAEYPTPARRPANSRLNCRKLEDTFGFRMREWRESLRKVLTEL